MLCQQSFAQTTVQEWIDQGSALYSQGKYDDSLQAFDKAIEIDPGNADAWYNKGVVLYDQGKYNDSLQAFNRSIETNPLDADAWYNKGSALKALGRTTAAEYAFAKTSELEAFTNASKLKPEDQGSTTQAESTDDKKETDTAEDWLNKGNALYNQGKYEDAIQTYDRAIELDPLNPEVWQSKGYALNKLGKNKEANDCFWKATGLNAGYASDRKQWVAVGQSEYKKLKGTSSYYALQRAQSKTSSDTVKLNPNA